jgi:hypothetical protein
MAHGATQCGVQAFRIVESSWNVMAHGDAREGKWRGNWRLEWVASTLHTTSEHGVSSITTADAHTSAASSRLNWRPRRFKWTRPFRRNAKSGFCTCAITFQTQSKTVAESGLHSYWLRAWQRNWGPIVFAQRPNRPPTNQKVKGGDLREAPFSHSCAQNSLQVCS